MTLKTTCVLTCLHTIVYKASPPSHGDTVWCPKCGDYRHVGVPPSTWVVHCVNCKRWANREYGRGFVTAETKAAVHAARAVGHRVLLLKDGAIFSEYYHAPMPIDLDGTVPF